MASVNQFQFTLFKVNLTYLCCYFGRMQLTEQAPHPHPRSYPTYLLHSHPPNGSTLDSFPMLPRSPLHACRTLLGCPNALLPSSFMISLQMGAQADQVNYTIQADAGLSYINVQKHTSQYKQRILPLQWAIDEASSIQLWIVLAFDTLSRLS